MARAHRSVRVWGARSGRSYWPHTAPEWNIFLYVRVRSNWLTSVWKCWIVHVKVAITMVYKSLSYDRNTQSYAFRTRGKNAILRAAPHESSLWANMTSRRSERVNVLFKARWGDPKGPHKITYIDAWKAIITKRHFGRYWVIYTVEIRKKFCVDCSYSHGARTKFVVAW